MDFSHHGALIVATWNSKYDKILFASKAYLSLFLCFFFFLFAGAGIDASDLTNAIRKNDLEAVKNLLKAKVNLEEIESEDTALSLAIRKNRNEITHLLLEASANPNVRLKGGKTPLMLAVCGKNLELVKLLLEYKADINATTERETMLVLACGCSNAEIVNHLFAAGLNKKKKVFSPIANRSPLLTSLREKNFTITDVLIQNGYDINEPSYNGGKSPLSYFAEMGEQKIIEYLLQKKADVNHRAQLGYTPLMFAATSNRLPIAKMLLGAGADINLVSSDGNHSTALSLATEQKHQEMIQLLLSFGAKSAP